MSKQEQIVRKASLIGNGAHIFVPKEWVGEEITLLRNPKRPVKERILEVLEPYLENVVGAFLFGSYARGEAREDSDIDLVVLTDSKIKIKKEGFGIICIEESKFKNALRIAPVMVYSMLAEAMPIINSGLLERLRATYKPKISDFNDFLNENKIAIQINEDLLERDKGKASTTNVASAYSLVLRLRAVFIIICLLKGKKYSFGSFKKWVEDALPGINFKEIYSVYLKVKTDKIGEGTLKTADLTNLLAFLKQQATKLKNGKKKKTT